jgi:hypothetical protein
MATEFQMVRVDIDLIERFDNAKPALVPRDPFIRMLLKDKLDEMDEAERIARRRKRARAKR